MRQRTELLMTAAFIGVTAIWGLTFVSVQDAVRIFPVTTFLAFRFLGSALLLLPIYFHELRRLPPRGIAQAVCMGIFLTGGYVLQTFGLKVLPVPTVGFITGLFVVFVPLLQFLCQGRRPPRIALLGTLISAIGLYWLTGAGSSLGLGDLLVLIAAVMFAAQILTTDAGVARYPAGGLVVIEMGVCGLICLIAGLWQHEIAVPHTETVWSALVVTGLLASAAGYLVQTNAQRFVAPTRSAIIMTAEPAFAAFFAFVLNGTTLASLGWAGAGLMMVAILVVEIAPRLTRARQSDRSASLEHRAHSESG